MPLIKSDTEQYPESFHPVFRIMILLYLEDEEEHTRRITSRGSKVEQRGSDRYIKAFSGIRDIQTYLVEEATKAKIPVIETSDSSKAISKMMDTIWDRILLINKKEKD